MLDKTSIRKEIKQKRLALSQETYEAMSLSCFENFKLLLNEIQVNTIGIYISQKNEVDTKKLIEYLWERGIEVVVPRCQKNGIMTFHRINTWDDVNKGMLGILEPKAYCTLTKGIDLMVIPLIGVNQEGYRLGMGGGYYDRYMSEHPSITIGFAFSFQFVSFHEESHDMKFDYMITEKGIINYK